MMVCHRRLRVSPLPPRPSPQAQPRTTHTATHNQTITPDTQTKEISLCLHFNLNHLLAVAASQDATAESQTTREEDYPLLLLCLPSLFLRLPSFPHRHRYLQCISVSAINHQGVGTARNH